MAFSDTQTQAIAHKDGPALVLAGPGSGKTTVITNRIVTLLERYHIPGSRILVITFTRAAAQEMQSRFFTLYQKRNARLDAARSTGVTFGTFHSVFYRILKHAYQYDASNILTQKEQYKMIESIIDELDMDAPDFNELASNLLGEISAVKSNCLSLDYYYAKSCPENVFRRVYRLYEKKLRQANKVDFDDILTMTYDLLSKRRDILDAWRQRFSYILIDEFQDINLVQYKTIQLLAAPKNNLFIVGDDDQSIYRFRGARPEIMLGFEKDYPNAIRIMLDINYRSDAYIVAAANHLIVHNTARFPKKIRASHQAAFPVLLKPCRDPAEQNKYLIAQLRDYHAQGYAYEQMAILFRTNLGIRFVMDALMKGGIPFHMKDAIPNLFAHWISLDIIAYLRLVSGTGNTRANWLRIMNRPNRYIKREALVPFTSDISVAQLKAYYQDKDWMLERLDRLEYDLSIMKRMSPYAAIHYLSNAMKYQDYLKDYAKEHHINEQELLDVLNAVHESSQSCRTFAEWFTYIDTYTEELQKQAKSPASNDANNESGVCLCTLHCAKGLEYPIVFIPDINEDNIPHARAAVDADLEEERRLFYVGITRAKEHLHLYCVSEASGKEKFPSRFLEELNEI